MGLRGGRAAESSGSEDDEEEAGFSGSYFLAKEKEPSSGKKRVRTAAGKLSDLNLVDQQCCELRASLAEIPPKHEKEVIATIAEIFWEQTKLKRKRQSGTRSQLPQSFASQSIDDIISFLNNQTVSFLNNQTADNGDDYVCLLIHSIDGPALRDAESQQCLAELSCCTQVRVVASADHANAPLCMPIGSLHTKCRENFLVSSQVTLNSHLTEFKDHDLLKIRKHSDGKDCLHIPLVSDALEKLLQGLTFWC